MRITGGNARGIPLCLPARGEIRPATDFLRGAVFSSLGGLVSGARVLDAFAGTGAYGLEALSRGAGSVCFIEKNPAAIAAIRANTVAVLKACQTPRVPGLGVSPPPPPLVLTADALAWEWRDGDATGAGTGFDLIFCDPPWALWTSVAGPLIAKLVSWADKSGGVVPSIVLEAPGGWTPPVPSGWQLHRHLSRGRNQPAASILRPSTA
ncbi:MAG: RsmD family RNA methyltransferase [Puniceicoccales bacterium]|jgi:16S rRNA (guanine966-N2)-methyltransferase|nr:RsmD family RNA methyltransferase [Puniceicoccales bacterium]